MKKLEVVDVSIGILYLNNDQHSDNIAKAIIDSDLTTLGYRGETPEKSINATLHLKKYSQYFMAGSYQAHFRLADRDKALEEHPEVRLALFALLKQRQYLILRNSNTIEFTFIGGKLFAVRNQNAPRCSNKCVFSKIEIPDSVSVEDIKEILKSK